MALALIEPVDRSHATTLTALFEREWWTRHRQLGDVERMLEGSDLIFGLVDGERQLVGFGRVLTDYVFKALVLDVIVSEPLRGAGEGRRLMQAVLDHPRLRGVRHFELYCLPEMMPFYESWGFSAELGRLRFMRRG